MTVPLELVEELTHPVRVERMLLFLYAELLKPLEVALGPLGLNGATGALRDCWLLCISYTLPMVIAYIHHQR